MEHNKAKNPNCLSILQELPRFCTWDYWEQIQLAVSRLGIELGGLWVINPALLTAQPLCLLNAAIFIIYRLSNHPDLVEILPILLENPENWSICDLYRKNPDLDICSDLFKRTSMILLQK